MPRKPRIEVAEGIHHVTSRGNHRADIFLDDQDRSLFLSIVARVASRFDADVFAYCLMDNHYHFVVRTHRPNLSALMAQLNGRYVQAFNRRHQLTGRLLEDRYKAFHVQEDSHLVMACAYVERNPVAAGLVETARQWRWSSFRPNIGLEASPQWLATRHFLGHVLGRDVRSPDDRLGAQCIHEALVDGARPVRLWQDHLRNGAFLGDEAFVARIRGRP